MDRPRASPVPWKGSRKRGQHESIALASVRNSPCNTIPESLHVALISPPFCRGLEVGGSVIEAYIYPAPCPCRVCGGPHGLDYYVHLAPAGEGHGGHPRRDLRPGDATPGCYHVTMTACARRLPVLAATFRCDLSQSLSASCVGAAHTCSKQCADAIRRCAVHSDYASDVQVLADPAADRPTRKLRAEALRDLGLIFQVRLALPLLRQKCL